MRGKLQLYLRRAGWVLLLGAACSALAAAADDTQCPASLAVEQTLSQPPATWTVAHAPGQCRLASITFYDGPPQDMASLVYDKRTTHATTWEAIWHFAPHAQGGYWVSCTYEHTDITLTKQLPAGVTQCVVSYEKDTALANGLPVIKAMRCQ
jgi:hypothetical protein